MTLSMSMSINNMSVAKKRARGEKSNDKAAKDVPLKVAKTQAESGTKKKSDSKPAVKNGTKKTAGAPLKSKKKVGVKFSKKTEKGKEKPAKTKLSNKEAHQKIKTLREERRKSDRSHYDVTVEMKQIWEDLRRHDLPKDQRIQLCEKVMTLVRGKERDFVFAHDTTRIFQTLCKYATKEIRSEVFESLKESIFEMTKSKYSVFFVRSLLRRGTKPEREYIIEKLMNNARRLITHKTAGPVVEFAYNEYANAKQRQAFAQQFYGPTFILNKSGNSQSLAMLLQERPEKKQPILRYMKEALDGIVRKEALGFTFVHNLLLEYMTYADDVEKQEMAETLQEHVAHIAHTREGAKAAVYVMWNSSAKGRKAILKQIKPFLDKLLTEEYAHLLLLAIFDCVDDTKLVSKLIVSAVSANLATYLDDKWARHIVMYLLNWRDPSSCNKEVRDFLSIGDSNPSSKKDSSKRQAELREELLPSLVVFASENLDKFFNDTQLTILLGMLYRYAADSMGAVTETLAKHCITVYSPDIGHVLDNKPVKITVSRILRGESGGAVAAVFTEKLTVDVIRSFITHEAGCYLLANVLSACPHTAARASLVKRINSVASALKEHSDGGKTQKLLLERLAE